MTADVAAAVDRQLLLANIKFDAAIEALVPAPRRMTQEEAWAHLAEQGRQIVRGMAIAAERASILLTLELFGTPAQRSLARQIMDSYR